MEGQTDKDFQISNGVLTTSLGVWRLAELNSVGVARGNRSMWFLAAILVATLSTWCFAARSSGAKEIPLMIWWGFVFFGFANSGTVSINASVNGQEVTIWSASWCIFGAAAVQQRVDSILGSISQELSNATLQPR
jgi:hypothetical protein